MESKNHNKNAGGEGSHEEQLTGPTNNGAEVLEIPIEKIEISEFCRRSNYDDIDPLMKSIDQNGLLQPGSVMENADGSYTLIFGSRRLEAHKRLGKRTFRCRVIHATAEQAAILSFAENSATEMMHPVEQARKLRLMADTFGWTEEDVAKEVGWKQSTVSEYLGILDLGEDILAKIDTRRESPFRFTHAQALSKLIRTKRLSRVTEVQQLLNKTIEHRLLCSELKALVHLFKKGHYDRLPDQLRTYLLKEKGMTSAMAMLYLEPESIIEGKGNAADRRRQFVQSLDRTLLKNTISKAAKAGWPYERAKQKLLDLIGRKSKLTAQKKEEESKPSHRMLRDDISVMHGRLEICISEVSYLAESDPDELHSICDEVEKLRDKLEKFSVSARSALDERELRQSA